MIITPEEKRQIIPITPETPVEASIPAPMSLIQQGKFVLNNSSLEEQNIELEMSNIERKTASQVRETAKIISRKEALDSFKGTLANETQQELINTAMLKLAERYTGTEYELEQLTVEALQRESALDPVQAYINENDKTFFEALGERMKKDLLISNKIQELYSQVDYADIGLNIASGLTFTNFLQRTFGFGLTDYGDELRKLQIQLEKASLDDIPALLDEQAELIRSTQVLGDNPAFVAEVFTLASTGSINEQKLETLLNVVDFVDTFFIASSFIKGVKGITGASKLALAAKDAGDTGKLAEDLMNAGGKYSEPDDPRNFGLMTGMKTEFDEADNLAAKVREEYFVSQRILTQALAGNKAISFDEVEGIDAFKGIRDRLKEQFNSGSINSFVLKADNTADVTVLKRGGSPYVSASSAKTAMKQRGITGEVYQLESGGWGIKVNVPTLDVEQANLSTKGVGRYTRWLGRPESWVDEKLLAFGQLSEASVNQIIKEGQKVYDRTIGKLSSKEREGIIPLLDRQREFGQEFDRWMTPEELDTAFRQLPPNRSLTEKEMTALAGYRLLNDFQYNLDNGVIFDRLNSQGYGSTDAVELGAEVQAKFVDSFPDSEYIYIKEGQQTLKTDSLEDGFLDKYDVLQVHDISPLTDLTEYARLLQDSTSYIAVPKGSVNIGDLRPDPLPYVAGGRRRYDDTTVFLKQKKIGTRSNGARFRTADRTLFTATSFPQAVREANKMNVLNAILRKGQDDVEVRAEAQRFIQERLVLGTDNIDEYLNKIKDRGLDLNEDVVPVRNRELITVTGDEALEEVGDIEMSIKFSGRLGKRGDGDVPSIDDSDAVLNALDSLNQNFVAAANNASFAAYREYAIKYMERFRPYLDVTLTDPPIKLLTANIKDGLNIDKERVRRILGEQQFAREVVGRQDPIEMASVRSVEKLVEGALDRLPPSIISGKYKNKLVAKSSDYLSQDVFGKMRGIIFNAKLGLFSIPAMMIQMAHAPIIAAMAPRHGVKALLTVPVLRIGLLSDDPQVIALFAKKAEKLGLEGYGDLQKFFQEFRNHGFDSFSANSAYENASRGDGVLTRKGVTGAASSFVEKGRIFFEEGEMVPRMTAYGVAVREWLSDPKLNPNKLPIDSKEGSRYISQRTNTLTLGMTKADIQQGLQSSGWGLMGQFQSYPLRALDAIVFPSKGLSVWERRRMILGYLMMYGSAGIPMMDSLADYLAESGFIGDSKTAHKILYNGVVDGFIMATTGENTNFASRGGLGDWASGLVRDIMDKRFVEVVTGPAGSTTGSALDTITDYAKAWDAGFNPDPSRIVPEVVMDLAKQVSGFNNLYRTWIAFQTGKVYDSRGNQFIEISNKGALLQLAGFPPQAYANIGEIYRNQDKRKEVIRLHTELLVKLHLDFARAKTPQEKRKISNMINAASQYAASDGLDQEVNAAVVRQLTGDSTYDNLVRDSFLESRLGEKGVLSTEMEAIEDGN